MVLSGLKTMKRHSLRGIFQKLPKKHWKSLKARQRVQKPSMRQPIWQGRASGGKAEVKKNPHPLPSSNYCTGAKMHYKGQKRESRNWRTASFRNQTSKDFMD